MSQEMMKIGWAEIVLFAVKRGENFFTLLLRLIWVDVLAGN